MKYGYPIVTELGRIRDASGNFGISINFENGKKIRLTIPDLMDEEYNDLPEKAVMDVSLTDCLRQAHETN